MERSGGKLLVYTSTLTFGKKRFQSISRAAEKIAKSLKLSMEVVSFGEDFSPIYVYYENGDGQPIPIYCDVGGDSEVQEICRTLRNMMFVLSFHPKHSVLKRIRKEVTQFS